MPTPQPSRLARLLSNPFAGFAPWILMGVIEGPHRLVLAAAAGCALAILMGAAGAALGMSPKMLDLVGIAYFGVLAALGALVDDSARQWLSLWSGEISNGVIVLVALGSIAIGTPFTIQYARQGVERRYWKSPRFLHVNNRITWAWTVAFAVIAIAGYVGDGPLHQPDNLWTNWVIQVAAIIVALRFTDWYPDYASARFETPDAPPQPLGATIVNLLRPLSVYLVPVGIASLVLGKDPWWVGVALIVAGILVEHRLRQDQSTVAVAPDAPEEPIAEPVAALATEPAG